MSTFSRFSEDSREELEILIDNSIPEKGLKEKHSLLHDRLKPQNS